MQLSRIHAYEVTPQRLAKSVTHPRGGAFSADVDFKKSLDQFFSKSRLQTQPTVDFRVKKGSSTAKGSHDVRALVIEYCFGAPPSAKTAAVALATRLGKAMDARSPFTLMLLAAYKDGATRRLVIWAFPKDEPFHFSARGDRARIKILKDAFSRSSSSRTPCAAACQSLSSSCHSQTKASGPMTGDCNTTSQLTNSYEYIRVRRLSASILGRRSMNRFVKASSFRTCFLSGPNRMIRNYWRNIETQQS